MSFLNEEYIADGVKEDCQKLIENFYHLESYNFNDFLKIWKEMKFSHIYSNLEYYAELLEYTEEVFLIVKHLWLDEQNLFKAIGGFYTLIGVYKKQPSRDFVKIRLTIEDLKLIHQFLTKCIEKDLKNIILMFDELKRQQAFIYVANERQYGLEYNFKKYFRPIHEIVDIEEDPLLTDLCNQFPEELNKYLNSKKAYLEKNKHLRNTLDMLTKDKVEDIVKTFSGITTIYNKNFENINEDDDQGNRRKKLKEKAFYTRLNTTTSNENTSNNDNLDGDEDVNDDLIDENDEEFQKISEECEIKKNELKQQNSLTKKRFWRNKLKYTNSINLKGTPNPESDKNIILDSFIKKQQVEIFNENNEEIENETEYLENLLICKKEAEKNATINKKKELRKKFKENKMLEKKINEIIDLQIPSTSKNDNPSLTPNFFTIPYLEDDFDSS